MSTRNGSGPPTVIRLFHVTGEGPRLEGRRVEAIFARHGYPGVRVVATRTIRFEGGGNLEKMLRLLANPAAGEKVWEIPNGTSLSGIEVCYRPAVIDPETPTGLEVAAALGANGLEYIRLGWYYEIEGVDYATAEKIVQGSSICNKVVQTVVKPGMYQSTLQPAGDADPLGYYDFIGMKDAELAELSKDAGWYAPLGQMRALQAEQVRRGRPWTDVEVEMILQSWSDHCYHTTWKGLGLFQRLKAATKAIGHPLTRSIFVDNAGAMAFYEDLVIFIKGESHNFPSMIFTLGGILTKHGGLLRDLIFMMCGGYPIGASTLMGTRSPAERGDQVPAGSLPGQVIVTESIEGTAGYCNPMGVPMMYAAYRKHPRYAKCWALGIGIGFAPERPDKEEPRKGDVLILIGGSTGRDGVHGATGSSTGLSHAMVEKEGAAVQIGHPITERQFTTVIPIARDKGWLRFLTDLGAGGISCAVGETIANCGADIDMTNLPVKAMGLESWVKWVSESQERGLLVVPPEFVPNILDLFQQFGVQAFVLGTCRDDHHLIVQDHGEVVVDMDLEFLWRGCPIEKLTVKNPQIRRRPVQLRGQAIKSISQLVAGLVADYSCADQSLALNQFDSTVQGRTVIGPLIGGVPSDAFVSKVLRDKPYGAVSSYAFNPRWSVADPTGSAANLLALAISRTIAIGVRPDEMVLCANWYNPTRTEEHRWYLKRMVAELCRFTQRVGIPVVSGKDSSGGTYVDKYGVVYDVPHTVVPSTLGRMPDVSRIRTKLFKYSGNQLVLILPHAKMSMAGSVAADLHHGIRDSRLPVVNQDSLLNTWRFVAEYYEGFKSIAAIGEGGLLMQLFYGCYGSKLGAEIVLPKGDMGIMELLGEVPGSFLVSLSSAETDRFIARARRADINAFDIGFVTDRRGLQITLGESREVSFDDWPILTNGWETGYAKEVLS